MWLNNIEFKMRTHQIGGFFIALFYPSTYIICKNPYSKKKNVFVRITYTKLQNAVALYQFQKESSAQKLLEIERVRVSIATIAVA